MIINIDLHNGRLKWSLMGLSAHAAPRFSRHTWMPLTPLGSFAKRNRSYFHCSSELSNGEFKLKLMLSVTAPTESFSISINRRSKPAKSRTFARRDREWTAVDEQLMRHAQQAAAGIES